MSSDVESNPIVAPGTSGDVKAAGVPRRSILQGLATTIAGAMVVPGAAAGAPHVAGAAAPGAQETGASAAAAAPAGSVAAPGCLTPHEIEMLSSLGEELVPGSTAAGVPALADKVLAVEPADVQRLFRNALGAFEREARVRHAKTWTELTAPERTAIVEAAAGTPSARPAPQAWKRGDALGAPPPDPAPASLGDHLVHLRDSLGRLYFSTEPGMRDLGWTGNVFWDALPQCTE